MAVTVQDLLNDPRYKDNKSLLLLARPDIVHPPKPRKKRKQKSTRQLIANLQEESKSIRQLLVEFIKKQEKFNNLVMKQFKVHGWIK